MAETKDIIKLEDMVKIYDTGAIKVLGLNRINLSIKHGEFVAIMGHSGSGKSTLLNILGCLDRPTLGHYYLDGIDVEQIVDRKLNTISYSTLKHGIAMLNLNGELFSSFKKDSVIKLTITENGSERNIDIVTNKYFPKYTTLFIPIIIHVIW